VTAHRTYASSALTVGAAVVALALPAPALAAKGSPVHVDPSSPVAKEYALPLATARGAPPESGQSGKLFGSGITTTQSVATPTATATAPTPTATTTPTPTVTTPTATAPTPTVTQPPPSPPVSNASAAPAAYKVLQPGSGSGVLWMVLAAMVVVGLGGAGGIVLRRRR
jgi:hypothetical protein